MKEFFIGLLWLNLVYHFAAMLNTSCLWSKVVAFNIFHANLWFNIYISTLIYKIRNMIKQDYLTITLLIVGNFFFYFLQVKVIPEDSIIFRIGFDELNLDISMWTASYTFIMNIIYLLIFASISIYIVCIFTLKYRADIETEKKKKDDLVQKKKTSTFIEYANSGDDSEHEINVS